MDKGFGIGSPVRRTEDNRLLCGQGRFVADVSVPGTLHAAMVRSVHAHARILRVDAEAARAMPGVALVLTQADCAALHPIPHVLNVAGGGADISLHNRDGSVPFISPHLPLPPDRVRYVGEVVAVVVAETLAQARDAAELVVVDYEPLPAVTRAAEAAAPSAPVLWPDAGSNVYIDADVGDAAATDAAFGAAAHVVGLSCWAPRITGAPMEPRGALVEYDARNGRFMLRISGGFSGRTRPDMAGSLGINEDDIRFVLPDVGGSFGTKNNTYVEYPLLALAARHVRRPVRWISTREESLLSDYQARDLTADMEMALDEGGHVLAMRGGMMVNVGGHTASFVPLMKGSSILANVYDVGAAFIRARAVGSNVSPVSPYRSAGRPEAIWVTERLMDLAARELGLDRVEIRRRNLIGEAQLPYHTATGLTYDSGDYQGVMDHALGLADWAGFPARRAEAAARGRCRGIGLCNYIEITTGAPRERARIVVHGDGRVELEIGTLPSGQGHQTSFAQLLVEWLGVNFSAISVVYGDTDRIPVGGGSHSGRSMRMGSIVTGAACDLLIDKGKRLAGIVLQCGADEIGFADGRFQAPDGRSLTLAEVARAAEIRNDLPEDLRAPFAAESDQIIRTGGYPYGAHVCEVEVDPETGATQIVGYAAVDDVGRAVNPMILHGQTHGGIGQGVGQALMEQAYYDRETGQMLAASFMDYAMPRADTLPSFVTAISEVPSPSNRLGIRAGGEGGTTGALGAVGNAIADALSGFGVRHVDMPATPERVWRAIQASAM
jgi:aerobic carbon-monoxide dehydrogenase large subunit